MSGRRLASVWKHFDRAVRYGKNSIAVCKSCKAELQGIPQRLEKHVQTCKVLKLCCEICLDSYYAFIKK